MMRALRKGALTGSVAVLILAGVAGCASRDDPGDAAISEAAEKPALGLFSGLPICWSPSQGFAAGLQGGEPHWVRAALEERYRLEPLDFLGESDGAPSTGLRKLDRLLIVQPRALTAADNVALDRWVTDGGHLFLALDPMLTEHFEMPIGDPNRPNVVALVPPVLKRWGLAFSVDENDQRHRAVSNAATIPVDQHGRLETTAAEAASACRISPDRIIASCKVGAGTVFVLADAALFDAESPEPGALDAAIEAAFP